MEQGDRVICAISGGADSVALLWCLYLLREQLDLKLSAAHLNHGLRGEESDRDEDFVRQLCAGYQIPLTVGRTQVQAQGRGLEDAARRARYTFLESLDPAAKIATAHTADDNAETVLLHLIRGAGLRGLGGIAPARGRVIRPMLGVTRQEVEAFLGHWNLPHVEDSSNGQPDFLRNRVRSRIMPLLRQENPRFARSCSETALTLRLDEAFLAQEAEAALDGLWDGGGLDCPEGAWDRIFASVTSATNRVWVPQSWVETTLPAMTALANFVRCSVPFSLRPAKAQPPNLSVSRPLWKPKCWKISKGTSWDSTEMLNRPVFTIMSWVRLALLTANATRLGVSVG